MEEVGEFFFFFFSHKNVMNGQNVVGEDMIGRWCRSISTQKGEGNVLFTDDLHLVGRVWCVVYPFQSPFD